MKNLIFIATVIVAALLVSESAFCQATVPGNAPAFGAHLGWDDIINTELNITQNNTLRKRFTSLPTYTGINGYTVSNANRMYFSENGNFQTPYSMLHMGSNMSTTFLQRPWMNVGVTMTSSQDILHLGIIDRPVSSAAFQQIDAVLAWGCNANTGSGGPDNFRFLFLQPTNTAPPTVAASQQGLETMRITPQGNVGIGDFSHMTGGLNEQPTQKLDVDGTARLRQMPTNEEFDVVITGIYAESPGVNGDYILNYSTIADFTDALNIECDWDVVNAGADVAMGYTGACVEAVCWLEQPLQQLLRRT